MLSRVIKDKVKKAAKKSTSGTDDSHGILEGISSLHSWIKTQTMIRPHPKGGRGKQGQIYDEVSKFYIFFFVQMFYSRASI